jgi:FlaA1/EpsC-like NDP-sugar epimerase
MVISTLPAGLLRLPPLGRRLLLIATDLLLIPLAVWLSFALRLATPWPQQLQDCAWIFLAAWLVALPIYAFTGQYKGITRYAGSQALYTLALRNLAVVLVLHAIEQLPQLPPPPRSSWLLLWLLLTGLTGLVRLVLRDLLRTFHQGSGRRRQALAVIYGAGEAGVQLAAALRHSRSHRVLAFLDENPISVGRHIYGIPVWHPDRLPQLIQRQRPSQILLAMPSISRSRRRQIVEQLEPTGIPVLQVPSMEEITAGRTSIDALRPIAIEELLGRDTVPPQPQLLGPGVAGKVVLVSGAGGSIGSELCRQILALGPRRLILLDNHEPSLHAIEQELLQRPHGPQTVLAVLASVTAPAPLNDLLLRQGVQVVFHAAAYKHVPMVEGSPLAGLYNNVIGTWVLARAAARCGVQSFTLISTDKAVRPTNVMGASKRVAEQVVQALALQEPGPTRFSMVRFGNVLGSSGSVVPIFRSQIARGGPITLTHPEIIRYFMTIPEASQLVLQAAVLAEGGDVFLLDMGEPVRIQHLAEQMVRLSGLSLRTPASPDGDIEIVCTGLRPGEKLFEELLIDADAQPTSHPLIYRAHERAPVPEQLWRQLQALEQAIERQDREQALVLLAALVPEWARGGQSDGEAAPAACCDQPGSK